MQSSYYFLFFLFISFVLWILLIIWTLIALYEFCLFEAKFVDIFRMDFILNIIVYVHLFLPRIAFYQITMRSLSFILNYKVIHRKWLQTGVWLAYFIR